MRVEEGGTPGAMAGGTGSADPLHPPPDGLPQWVIADTHFFHAQIQAYGDRPADHEARIIQAWRDLVAPADTVLHLGDVALGPPDGLAERLPELPGRVFLLRGNHDSRRRLAVYATRGWTVLAPFALAYRGWTIQFRHAPLRDLPPRTLLVHGHTHQLPDLSPQHLNVSVERMGYRPVALQALIDERLARLDDAGC